MKPIKLLVISPQCIESVNRAVYRLLATHYNINVHLVIPAYSIVGEKRKEYMPVDDEPFETTLLEPIGTHARLQRLNGLEELILLQSPTHIFVDADPATMLMRDVLQAKNITNSFVCALTLENMDRGYLQEGFNGLLKGNVKIAVGGVLTWYLLKTSQKQVDHVFCICEDGVRVMSKLGFAGRITKMPLGIDTELFHIQNSEKISSTRNRLGLNVRTVAYFGRMIPEKGVALLIKALSGLKDIKWQFMIDRFTDYDSPFIMEIRKLINESGISDRIVFFDASHKEIPDYMNAADIVVLPSISTPKFKEQYGRVIPEAMACGKVVICSNTGALPELLSGCGYIFPEGDITAISERLRFLLTASEDDLEILRGKARKRAVDKLSIVSQAEIFLATMSNT